MARQRKVIPLVKGQDDSVGMGHSGGLRKLVNGRVTREGEVRKRRGFDALSTAIITDISTYTGTLPVPTNLVASSAQPFVHRAILTDSTRSKGQTEDEVVLLTDSSLLTKDGQNGWISGDTDFDGIAPLTGKDVLSPKAAGVGLRLREVSKLEDTHTQVTSISGETYTLVAWLANSVIRYSIIENLTGTVVIDSAEHTEDCTFMMAVGSNNAGSNFGIVYIKNANIKLLSFTPGLFAPTTYTLKTTARNTGTYAPIYAIDGPGNIVVLYEDNSTNLTAFFSTFSGTVSGTTAYSVGTVDCCAIAYDSANSRYYLAAGGDFGAGVIVKTKVVNASLVDQALNVQYDNTDVASKIPIRITIGVNPWHYGVFSGNLDVHLAWQCARGAGVGDEVNYDVVQTVSRYRDATTALTPVTHWHTTLLTTPYKHNGHLYLGLGHQSTLQGAFFVALTGAYFSTTQVVHNIAGRVGYGLARGDLVGNAPPVPLCGYGQSNEKLVTANLFKTRYDTDTDDIYDYEKTSLVTVDLVAPVSAVKVNDAWYIANGSILKVAHNSNVYEANFLLSPEDLTVTFGGSGGLATGSYTWRAYYVSYLGGKRVRSYAASVTGTATSGQAAALKLKSLTWTQRKGVGIEIYRTTVNPTASTPFYRVTSYRTTGADWVLNDYDDVMVSYTDDAADADLLNEEYDYIYTGEVAHVAPDATSMIAEYNDRIIVANDESIYPALYGGFRLGLEFSDEVAHDVPVGNGPITGLIQLGNNLVIFKRNRIYAVTGPGLNNTATEGGFSDPATVSHSIGISNMSQLTRIPGGAAFCNGDGFYTINDAQQVQYIGTAIRGTYESLGKPTIVGVVYDSVDNCIVFSSRSHMFVYYTLVGVWSVWTQDNTVQCLGFANGNVYIGTGNIVAAQSDSVWTDDYYDDALEATVFNHIIGLDYVALAENDVGVRGRAISAEFVGKYYTGAVYNVYESFDNHNESSFVNVSTQFASDGYTVPTSPVNTVAPLDRSRFEYHFANQRCSTVRVELAQSDDKQGAGFTHIILNYRLTENNNSMSPNRAS